MSHQDDLSPRERARAACPPGRPRALFTLDELRARRRNSLELDRLCGQIEERVAAFWQPMIDEYRESVDRYVQEHDGHGPSRLPHNSDYGATNQGDAR